MQEVWKDIYYVDSISGEVVDFRGYYQVSNLGRVKRLKREFIRDNGRHYTVTEKILKGWKDKNGYNVNNLKKGNDERKFRVHRLVAHMFIPNPENKPEIDHIIPIKNGGSNNVNNLRWVTSKENSENELTKRNMSGENHHYYNKKGKDNPFSMRVARYDYHMNLIDIWDGISEAQRVLKISHISDACRGKRNYAGKDENGNPYYWKYVE